MNFVAPDSCLQDYRERRRAFLKHLIASTPERERARQRVSAMDRRKLP